MYRNILLTRFLLNPVPVKDWCSHTIKDNKTVRCFTMTANYFKKRKSEEERKIDNAGRKVIRYSPKGGLGVIGVWKDISVRELAGVLNKTVDHVLDTLPYADKTSNIHYKPDTVIHNQHVVRDVIKISGYRFRFISRPTLEEDEKNKDAVPAPPAPPEALRPRPPVICVMGHVDHGKTTLLDSLRNTSVVETEFGGITQHIGAFEVAVSSGSTVTFLDTPGHAAFSSMRARGAAGADIVVLIVAADDGAMPQTHESVKMAERAGVPIVVAVNKVDKPGVNIDRTLRSLAQIGVVCESLGGEIQAVPISALKRQNLDTLVEALHLQAQMLDLKSDPSGNVEGVVLESSVDPKVGKQATVLVQRGTLRKGCVIVAGTGWGKVRILQSAEGRSKDEAPPSCPVSVLGWRELPAPGDLVLQVPSEKRAGEVMRWRANMKMREKQEQDLEVIQDKEQEHRQRYRAELLRKRALGRRRVRPDGPRTKLYQDDHHPTVSVVVKGDVDGSVEAIIDILESYEEHEVVKLDLVHFGVGPVTPGDVEIAETFGAVVFAFNTACPPALAADAKARGVAVRSHNVIYKLVDDVKQEINDKIPTRQVEEVIGEANILQTFSVTEGKKTVTVAGSRCVKGQLNKLGLYRILRNQQVIYEGKLASMKHLKEEVSTIKRDTECGLRFQDGALQLQPGDTIVCYKLVDVQDKTSWNTGF